MQVRVIRWRQVAGNVAGVMVGNQLGQEGHQLQSLSSSRCRARQGQGVQHAQQCNPQGQVLPVVTMMPDQAQVTAAQGKLQGAAQGCTPHQSLARPVLHQPCQPQVLNQRVMTLLRQLRRRALLWTQQSSGGGAWKQPCSDLVVAGVQLAAARAVALGRPFPALVEVVAGQAIRNRRAWWGPGQQVWPNCRPLHLSQPQQNVHLHQQSLWQHINSSYRDGRQGLKPRGHSSSQKLHRSSHRLWTHHVLQQSKLSLKSSGWTAARRSQKQTQAQLLLLGLALGYHQQLMSVWGTGATHNRLVQDSSSSGSNRHLC